MTCRIVVVGSINMDLNAYTSRIPIIGETIMGKSFSMCPGGKGANQSVAAVKLGADVAMVGRVGSDFFADNLINNLKQEGVDTTFIKSTPDINSGIATILVDDNGQNTIVVVPGANAKLTPQDIVEAEQVIASSDSLLVQLESPIETIEKAAQIAHDHHVKVILNPAPAQRLPPSLNSLIDVLIPNETECFLLANLSVNNFPEAEIAARKLLVNELKTVIVTFGERGALLVTPSSSKIIPPFIVQAIDTVAAGDAFVSAYTVAASEGKSMIDSIVWGNAAGALTTTKYGAQASLPTREMVQKLIENAKPESLDNLD